MADVVNCITWPFWSPVSVTSVVLGLTFSALDWSPFFLSVYLSHPLTWPYPGAPPGVPCLIVNIFTAKRGGAKLPPCYLHSRCWPLPVGGLKVRRRRHRLTIKIGLWGYNSRHSDVKARKTLPFDTLKLWRLTVDLRRTGRGEWQLVNTQQLA